MTAAVDPAAQDAAWVSIETPLPADRLARFCSDIERLYRINPYLEFARWHPLAPGRVAAAWRNSSNGRDYELELAVERASDREFTVRYDRGLKACTRFRVEETAGGSRLVILDDYSGAAGSSAVDTAEVDKSLHAWGVALHEYLRREARWGRYAPWRWYMRRVWMPMKPAARRITFMLAVVTVAELALIAFVAALYWLEQWR